MAEIIGTDANSSLTGTSAADPIYGRGGNDMINGDCNATGDDEPSPQGQLVMNEIVFGFNGAAGDRFDVATIDANANQAGHQAFDVVGTAPVDQAREIGVLVSGGVTYVVAETSGAADAELMIQMSALGANLAARQFLL